MSFWFHSRNRKGKRNWYSVSAAIPALLFFAILLAMLIAKAIRLAW